MATDDDTTPMDQDGTTQQREVWVEKHRPSTLSEVVGQDDIVNQLQGYVASGDVPHLLFAGSAGLGKTTSAVALAKDLYGDDWSDNFLELNASDDRGIDVVRDRIKSFARSSFGQYDYRIIFLDEADSLTDAAQAALRRTMEQFTNNIRFILSCNYSSQIIDPIQSRCSVHRFTSANADAVIGRLETIAEEEGVDVTDDGYEAIAYAANGDIRRAVNMLQAGATRANDGEPVTEEMIYEITSTPRPEEIEAMLVDAVGGNHRSARTQLDDLLNERGLSGGDVLAQIHQLVWDLDVSDDVAVDIMDKAGEVDYRIAEGGNERIQLESLLASL